MVTKLDDVFRFHEQALNLRVSRQQVLASNIANVDTPNYKARDIDFNAELNAALADRTRTGAGDTTLATTAPHHLAGSAAVPAGVQSLKYRVPAQASVDGNTVEMDAERAQFADNAVHYEANLTVLGMQIKNLLTAIQGQ